MVFVLLYKGGYLISQPHETAKEAKGFVCSNASCRRVFTHPLRTVNVGVSAEPYNACPYCLTEVNVDTEEILVETLQKGEPSTHAETKKRETHSDAPEGCKNLFGYLGQRNNKEIPDECLTCKLIVQCMAKKD